MKKSTPIILLLFLFFINGYSQTTIKTMFYNLLHYPSALPTNREVVLKRILDSYQPDIFAVCELESQVGADEILTQSIQTSRPNFARANFVSNQSSSNINNQLQQLIFYNTDKLTLVSQQVHTTYIRDINQYTLLLNTVNQATNPIKIEYFVSHFKASNTPTNEAIRLDMANVFTAILANISPNSYVVFSGDFNFYTSTETGYQKILDPTNTIKMVDLLNTNNTVQNWHNNASFINMHTQCTRVAQLNGDGASGGMDDRFDFSFISQNLTTSTQLHYVQNSYHSYGNNANCFNMDISNGNCTGTYSQSLRNDLFLMSDHLPVVMELQTPQNTLSTSNFVFKPNISIIGSNLVNNTIFLNISSKLFNSNLAIYNQLGQLVKTIKTATANEITCDVTNLHSGIYIIKSQKNKFINPLKFIKLN